MKSSDIVIGERHIQVSPEPNGTIVTVIGKTTRKTPSANLLDYPGLKWDEQEQTGDPYWRGAPESTVCVQYEDGRIRWTRPQYIIRPV